LAENTEGAMCAEMVLSEIEQQYSLKKKNIITVIYKTRYFLLIGVLNNNRVQNNNQANILNLHILRCKEESCSSL
jgi:hypothetical protein